jgi:hypothetical protein
MFKSKNIEFRIVKKSLIENKSRKKFTMTLEVNPPLVVCNKHETNCGLVKELNTEAIYSLEVKNKEELKDKIDVRLLDKDLNYLRPIINMDEEALENKITDISLDLIQEFDSDIQ